MDRIYESGAVETPPPAPESPSAGYPSAGNPATATPATKPGPYWYHMITESLRRVIVDAGLTPAANNLDLLKNAIFRAATEAVAGVLRIATQAETNAGTADNRIVTPAKLRFGFLISLGSNGYIVFPAWMGRLIVQWNTLSGPGLGAGATSYVSGNHPIAFPNGVFQYLVISSSDGYTVGASAFSAAAITITYRNISGGSPGATALRYIAIGY